MFGFDSIASAEPNVHIARFNLPNAIVNLLKRACNIPRKLHGADNREKGNEQNQDSVEQGKLCLTGDDIAQDIRRERR